MADRRRRHLVDEKSLRHLKVGMSQQQVQEEFIPFCDFQLTDNSVSREKCIRSLAAGPVFSKNSVIGGILKDIERPSLATKMLTNLLAKDISQARNTFSPLYSWLLPSIHVAIIQLKYFLLSLDQSQAYGKNLLES